MVFQCNLSNFISRYARLSLTDLLLDIGYEKKKISTLLSVQEEENIHNIGKLITKLLPPLFTILNDGLRS